MSFSGLRLTNAGVEELAKATCGEKFCFTHIVFGDGECNGTVLEREELVHPVMELPIGRITRENNEVILECDFNSMDVPLAFYWREVGIIVNEKLCYYDCANSAAEYINPQSDAIIKQKRIKFVLLISSDIEVNVTVSSSLYALLEDLQAGAYAKIANDDSTAEEGYVADARIVAMHGEEIDAIKTSVDTLMNELFNSATESDIDQIINGTYADVDESEFADIASESDIDEIIGGTYTGSEDNTAAVYAEIDEIVDKTFN